MTVYLLSDFFNIPGFGRLTVDVKVANNSGASWALRPLQRLWPYQDLFMPYHEAFHTEQS